MFTPGPLVDLMFQLSALICPRDRVGVAISLLVTEAAEHGINTGDYKADAIEFLKFAMKDKAQVEAEEAAANGH